MTGRFNRFAKTFRSFYTGRYAVVTNTITAGTMGGIADSVAQFVETRSPEKSWNFERSKNMTTVAFGFGPVVHFWYKFLDSRFPGRAGRMIFKKVFWDVAVAPIFYFGYLGFLSFLKSLSYKEFQEEFKNKVPLLLGADLVFWPVLQSANFVLLPAHYRIIGLKCNEVLMGTLISHILNNSYSVKGLLEFIKK